MAGQHVSLRSRLPCTVKPSRTRWPAAGMVRAGVRRRAALRVHDAQLPDLRVLIPGEHGSHRLLGAHPGAQHLQANRSEGHIHRCLGGDRTHACFQPRHHRPDAQVMRLHRDPEAAGLRVARDDGIGHARSVTAASAIASSSPTEGPAGSARTTQLSSTAQ